MDKWLDRFSQFHPSSKEEAIFVYADSHLSFVSIHHFFDGNGRMARLMSNFPLLQSGFPPIIISNKKRKDYTNICAQFQITKRIFPDKDDCSQFIIFLDEQWNSTWDIINKAYEQQKTRDILHKENGIN